MHQIWLFILSNADVYLYNASSKQINKIDDIEKKNILLYVKFPKPTIFIRQFLQRSSTKLCYSILKQALVGFLTTEKWLKNNCAQFYALYRTIFFKLYNDRVIY